MKAPTQAELEAFAAFVDRMHNACLTAATFPHAGPRGFFSTWPAYRLEWWDAQEAGAKRTDEAITERLVQPPRFYPTPRQIDECLPTLALLNGEAPMHRAIVAARAFQRWYRLHGGWRVVGDRFHMSHTRARKIHDETILSAWRRRYGAALRNAG